MSIKISGVTVLSMSYEVVLDMTQEEFDKLHMFEKELLLQDRIDFYNNLSDVEVQDVEIFELEEVKDVEN